MVKRIYVFIKDFITENYLILLFYLIMITTLTYPLPYYIYTSGGLVDVAGKIEIENKTKSKGSYNLCYVSEYRATIPTYIMSFFKKDWEVEKIENVTLNKTETENDIKKRDKLYLTDANSNALLTAFNRAGASYNIITSHPIVIYIMEQAKTDLKIGDEIISIDDNLINEREDITNYLDTLKANTKVNVKVMNNNKEYIRYAKIIHLEDNNFLGVSVLNKISVNTDPKVNFTFSNSDSGPSGGLIVSLALYDFLLKEDVTKGYKISGTGTIDSNGNVGSIGGVKYKLKGAVKKDADIFFVPAGSNYKEAIKLAKKYNYKIKIVGVKNIDDAIKYLKEL